MIRASIRAGHTLIDSFRASGSQQFFLMLGVTFL